MIRRKATLDAALCIALMLFGGIPLLGQASAAAAAPAEPRHVWVSPDGKPLPFQTDEEIIQFLKTAKVVKDTAIPTGITAPRKLLVEKDGVRANAKWSEVNEERRSVQLPTGPELGFRDSYLFDVAAYHLSVMLGMDSVPPAVVRSYEGTEGEIQIWVENAQMELDRVKKKINPPDLQFWNKQLNEMNIFDALIYNIDRTRENILITPDWKVWLIDHTRAFRRNTKLPEDARIVQCERTMFEKLKALDLQTLLTQLKPYLRKDEITAVIKRRDLIVASLNQAIKEKGEDQVLFTLAPPQTPTTPPPAPEHH